MGSAIEAINLTKYYDDLLAVDHINFQVEQGEIFGFLGPNGAGKTTTIRMLTGISRPTEGTAKIIGYDIQRQSVSAKEQMGIVPDVSNVYKDLSAWDNILFLDEPTSGLDVQSVLIIRDLIRKLNHQGLTIFITTHNIEEASQMCDRVAIINHGKIATIDTPEKLKRTMESLQSVEIAFEATPQNALKDLEELPQVSEAVKQGDKFKLFTRDPSSVLASTWNYAQNNNLKLITVNTVGPTLEDVFVKLTGIN